MNIGVDPASATLVGAGAAPSSKDSAAPGDSARHASHFQSLVDGGNRPETARAPAARAGVRPSLVSRKSSALVRTAPHARTSTHKAAATVEEQADTASAAEARAATPDCATADRASSEGDSARPARAGTEGASDSDLLSAMAAIFGLPIARPSQPTADEQDSKSDDGDGEVDSTVTSGSTRASRQQELEQAPPIAPAAVENAAGTDATDGSSLFDPASAQVTALPQRTDSLPVVRAGLDERAAKAAVMPPPSAAARALARALGALTGQAQATPPAAPSEAPTVTDSGPNTTRAVRRMDGTNESTLATSGPSAAVAARVAATQPTGAFAMTSSQGQSGDDSASAEGAIRKASTTVQARQLASAVGLPAAEVPTSRAAVSAPAPDGAFRVEAGAVQPAQSGQQASIGLAAAVSDPAATRDGTVAEQLVKAIRIQVRDGIGEARLSLRPDHMGEVSVQLRVDKGHVSATLVVERPDVRAQIEAQGAALRSGLEAQGLHLEELVVREDGERRKGQGQDGQREQSGKRRRRPGDQAFVLDDA